MPKWVKQWLMMVGVLAALPGLALGVGYICVAGIGLLDNEDTLGATLVLFVLATVLVGGGGIVFVHLDRALRGEVSTPVRFPSARGMAGVFGMVVVVAWFVYDTPFAAFLFPPALVIAATLPSLAAVAWFAGRGGDAGLTWRRGLLAFVGGGTVGILVAIVLEILLPLLVLSLVAGLAEVVLPRLETLFSALANENVAHAVTSRGFVYLLVQVAVVAPLAEELAKPLVVLPVVGRLIYKFPARTWRCQCSCSRSSSVSMPEVRPKPVW